MSLNREKNPKRKADYPDPNETDESFSKIIRLLPSKSKDAIVLSASLEEDQNKKGTNDKGTNTEEEYICDIEKILKHYSESYKELEREEYKQMLQKFYLQNLRLATRCQKLKAAIEKNQTTTTRILREASKQVNPYQLALISSQLINKGKAPKKRVWSPQMKNIMVGLYQTSPNGFKFLSKALMLPEEELVVEWISQGSECDILDEDILKKKEKTSNESQISVEAQAVLDEIAFENLMATLI